MFANQNDKEVTLSIINNLVNRVLNQDEMGGCVFCGGNGLEGAYGYCNEDYACHRKDCAWVAGRKLLKAYGVEIVAGD